MGPCGQVGALNGKAGRGTGGKVIFLFFILSHGQSPPTVSDGSGSYGGGPTLVDGCNMKTWKILSISDEGMARGDPPATASSGRFCD